MSLPNVPIRTPPITDRGERAALALAGVAWAFFDSYRRNDTVRATTLLVAFQELYNRNRAAAALGFDDQQAALQILPMSLPTNGVYSVATRTALVGALVSGITIRTGAAPNTSARVDTMPQPYESFILGDWFGRTVVPLTSPGSSIRLFLDDMAHLAATSQPQEASANVMSIAQLYITGGSSAIPAADGAAANTQGRTITQGQDPASIIATRSAPVYTPEAILVTGRAPGAGMPAWGYALLGVGALAFGGIVVYQIQRQRGGRRRR